jgi:hypothetical protein
MASSAPVNGDELVGLQRLHGRKPAVVAASAEVKKRTRSRRGRRLGQLGRQNIPVLVTA